MQHSPFLSVIIPAYNEESRLASTLGQITDFFSRRSFQTEIIVVDDGSVDHTRQAGDREFSESNPVSIRVLSHATNRGKGYSVRQGMLASRGRYALLTDADLSTPISEFEKLEAEVVKAGFAIAIGSRDIPGSRVEVPQSKIRENSGKLFNLAVRSLMDLPFRDTQCGFKLFEMKVCRGFFEKQQLERFGFDVEILFLARKKGLQIKEVPVIWRHSGGSKVSMLRDGIRMVLDLFTIRWNYLRGKYAGNN